MWTGAWQTRIPAPRCRSPRPSGCTSSPSSPPQQPQTNKVFLKYKYRKKQSCGPDNDPDPIRIQGFDDQKLKKKKIHLKIFYLLFLLKIAIYLCPSYRRSLSALKREHPALKKLNLLTFSMFVGHFCPPFAIRIRIQIRIRIHNTGKKGI